MLDGSAGLDRLDLQRSADVRQHGGPEGQRLRVVLLPALILRPQVEGAGVLEVGREDDGLITGLARKLDTQVPRVEGDEGEVEVLCCQVLGGKGIEAVDGIAEGASVAYVLPGQGGQARCEKENVRESTFISSFPPGRICVFSFVLWGLRVIFIAWSLLTAQGRDWGVDRLDENALTMKLLKSEVSNQLSDEKIIFQLSP